MDALETRVFVGEILTYYHVLTRSLVAKKIPVVLQIPSSIIYWSLLGEAPDQLSSSLTHLTEMKRSVHPMAAARKEVYLSKGDQAAVQVMESQLDEGYLSALNDCTRDALSLLCQEPVQPDSESLFNSGWTVVESEVMDAFGVETHPALLARLVEFKALTDNKKTSWTVFIKNIRDNRKYHREYVKFMWNKEPKIMEFFEAMGVMEKYGFGKPVVNDKAESQISQGRHSVATRSSGIGTMNL